MNKKDQKHKIVFYCSSTSHGGLELNIIRLLVRMQQRGTNITLFAIKGTPIYEDAKNNDIEIIEITENKKYFDFRKASSLAKILKSLNTKILFVGATRDVAFASLLKRLFYKKLKLVYHEQMQIGINKKDIIHTVRYSAYDSWIAPLPYLKREIEQRTNFNPKKISVIPLGIDTKYFSESKLTKKEAREEMNLPQNRKIIGILGRIDPLKRQDFLIRSINFMHHNGYKVDLLIMGEPTANTDDRFLNKVKDLIKDFKLQDHVHIRPFSDNTLPFFKAIDVFAMTTKSETFGMVTVEAMAAGVPVIAARSGGSVEILEHGTIGALYNSGNMEDFTTDVIKIFTQPNHFKNLKKLAQKAATEKYDLDVESKGFEEIIAKLLNP